MLKIDHLRILFVGSRSPENEDIQARLSDGLHCEAIFDWAETHSDFRHYLTDRKYHVIIVDKITAQMHHSDVISRAGLWDIPVIYLLETPGTVTPLDLIDKGVFACVHKREPDYLVVVVYKAIQVSGIIRDRLREVPASGKIELFIHEIIDNLVDAFYVVDQDWCLRYVNNKALLFWGRRREELLGKVFWDCFPELEHVSDCQEAAMTNRIPLQWEAPSPDRQNWSELSACPLQDGGLAVFFHDITEKKRAEAVLRSSRDRQAVMLQLSDSLRLLDSPGDIHGAAARILGTYLDVEGAFCCDVVTIDGVDYFLLENPYDKTGGTIVPGLYPIDNPDVLASEHYEGRNIVVCDMENDGRIKDADRPLFREKRLGAWVSVPLMRNGRFAASFTVLQLAARRWTPEEISLLEETTARTWAESDRVRAEDALRKSEQRARQLVSELEKAARNKNDFINALSHELRNPLAAIVAGLATLNGLDRNPNTRSARDAIKRQTDQLGHLVDDLLDHARITNNKIQLKPEVIDISALARACALDSRPLFAERYILLETRLSDAPLYVRADPVRIAQAVGNLLHNACKFTGFGGKTILSTERQADSAKLVVRDDGIGIEPEFIPDLFKIPRQAAPHKGGLGLGLSIVKSIVDLHGGSIRAESDGPGRGAVFTITLPLAEPSDVQPEVFVKKENRPLKPLRILLIDDNRDLADLSVKLLRLCGYTVDWAYTGTEGLAKAEKFLPDVILCDIGLPDVDGYEVARRLARNRRLRGIRLISLSGYAQATDIECSREAGFETHISKPFDLDVLKTVLNSAGPKNT